MKRENESRRGTIEVKGEYATITFNRVFHHAPEAVWEAITDPQELKGWLMCSSAKIDGRTGGSVEMVAGPAQFRIRGKILTWDPPRVFEHEWKVDPTPEMPKGEDAVFRYELTRQGDSTLLVLTYRHLTAQTAQGFAPGSHVLLDRLDAQLDKHPLPDWMKRFQELQADYPAWKK